MTFYDGLKLIQQLKLPHPIWQFVRRGSELKNLKRIPAYVGWTIRTAAVRGAPYQNLYVNWLPRAQVAGKVEAFQRRLKGRGRFVVYPSWRWRLGGAVLVEPRQAVIEVVRGAVVELARQGRVEARYILSQGRLKQTQGKSRLLRSVDLAHLKALFKALGRRGSYYAEWGVSTKGQFVFYRLTDLASEGRALLRKYAD